MKEAKSEAEDLITAYTNEKEAEFQATRGTGATDAEAETLRAQTGRDVGQMKAQFASNAGTVVSTMLGHVAAVNLEVPAARLKNYE